MPQQRVLDSQVWCPLSGFKMKDGMIVAHKISLLLCCDGVSLYGRCATHVCKVFIQDSVTVRKILEQATVLRVKDKRPRTVKLPKKEKANGQA